MKLLLILTAALLISACHPDKEYVCVENINLFTSVFLACLDKSKMPDHTHYADGDEVVEACQSAAWSVARHCEYKYPETPKIPQMKE